jgi:hypothetical protein
MDYPGGHGCRGMYLEYQAGMEWLERAGSETKP